jgi:hypothetical protein
MPTPYPFRISVVEFDDRVIMLLPTPDRRSDMVWVDALYLWT